MTDITFDFETGLPTDKGYNAVLIVVDQLTKERCYISYTTEEHDITAEVTTYLLLKNVWKLHDLLLSLTSDQGP